MTLVPLFVAGWILWAVGLLYVEFVSPLNTALWLWLAAHFGLLEGAAIVRKGRRDTLSEQVWAFYSGRVGRIPLIVGFTSWLCLRVLGLGLDVQEELVLPGRIALVTGLFAWLIAHFIGRDKYG